MKPSKAYAIYGATALFTVAVAAMINPKVMIVRPSPGTRRLCGKLVITM